MDDLEGTLQRVLGDPEAMAQVASLAKQLGIGQGGGPDSQPLPVPEAPVRIPEVLQEAMSGGPPGNSGALLAALRPLMRPERVEKLDRAARALRLARAAKAAMGLLDTGGGRDV